MKVAVSLSVGFKDLIPQVAKIIEALQRCGVEPLVILAGHEGIDPEGSQNARITAETYPQFVRLALVHNVNSWSYAYLNGMAVAVASGADFVVSMDSDGAHDPGEIGKFIDQFRLGNHVVLATRFSRGGGHKYPLQRKIISFAATMLSNLTLGRQWLTDFTSGYEGLSAEVIKRLFAAYPPVQWISVVTGPYHLQNSELRMVLMAAGYKIVEVPIVYGKIHKGKALKTSYVFDAFKGYFALLKSRSNVGKYFETHV